MSNTSQPTHSTTGSEPKGEHGTVQSYVTGFALSLLFTAIPYIMVVEQVVSGNALLATILGFALLQMIIQIVFFLHLGRGPKPRWNIVFFVGTVGIILVVVGGSIWIMHHLHYNMTPVTPVDASKKLIEDEGIAQLGGEKTGACTGPHVNHKVTIQDGRVSPAHITAQVCDTLTFINEDEAVRKMTFAQHPDHGVYAGQSEVSVRKGRAKMITLSEQGTYQFHDHLQEETAGSFTVAPGKTKQ